MIKSKNLKNFEVMETPTESKLFYHNSEKLITKQVT